jgi:hypothetical protein
MTAGTVHETNFLPQLLEAGLGRSAVAAAAGRAHSSTVDLIRETTRCASEPRFLGRRSSWRRSALRSKAIQRVVTEGISPEQAVDEAITRIK